MRMFIAGFAAATALGAAASAQTFEGSDGIELREVFATVTIKLDGDGPLTLARTGPGADDLRIREDRAVSILGEFEHDAFKQDFRAAVRKTPKGVDRSERAFLKMLEDQPTLTIVAAPGTAIRVVDGAVKLTVEGDAGAVEITHNAMLLVEMDDFETGSIEVAGPGDVRVGNIADAFKGMVHGSGDLTFENAGSAKVTVHGSGDLEGRVIRGDLIAAVHGSGDLELTRVGGDAEASVHGSGDLDLGAVNGALKADVHGSGDLTADSVSKHLKASVRGSGDVNVVGGAVEELVASVSGSGELTYGGEAKTADLSSSGSGSIDVGKVSGNLTASGKGISVDGKRVGGENN
ncbi:MAG: DUF2807 domain-containing protein [Pseudomonadota bacterium]